MFKIVLLPFFTCLFACSETAPLAQSADFDQTSQPSMVAENGTNNAKASASMTKQIDVASSKITSDCSADQADSQKGAPCQESDIDGDGALDRIRIARPGEYAVTAAISEYDDAGEGIQIPVDWKSDAVVVALSSSEERAINLPAASGLKLVTNTKLLPKGCVVDGDTPIALASSANAALALFFSDGILTARRC